VGAQEILATKKFYNERRKKRTNFIFSEMLSRTQNKFVLGLSKRVCNALFNKNSNGRSFNQISSVNTMFLPTISKIHLTNASVRHFATNVPPKVNEQPLKEDEQKNPENEPGKAKEAVGKVKAFIKKYGIPGLIIYFAIYFLTLGGLYVGIANGLIRIADVDHWLKKFGLDKYFDLEQMENKKNYTNFAFAWIMTKFTEPLRFALTLAITPYVLRVLRLRRGG
jgi:hypothetical protein